MTAHEILQPPYTCKQCGATTGEWAEGWAWYGSWKELENGPIFEPPAVVCSVACREAYALKHHLDPAVIG